MKRLEASAIQHKQRSLNRREMLQISGLATLGFLLDPAMAPQSVHAAQSSENQPLNHFPRMVQEYFVRRVREAEANGLALKNSLQSKSDAEAYVQSVREKIQQSFGPFPEKTPLNPRITGTVERDAYTIENVIFESRPGFLVTANLYIPKNRSFPLPGVVGTCGHSTNGKAAEAYQSYAQGLARLGYVVLIYDPISQGERLQYVDENLQSKIGVGVREHLYAGNQQFLIGEFIGSWRAWDGIRALDYLLTRDEVDPKQVGVTGNSGGGTMTTWLCGVEQRWNMAAPSCFVTTFRRNMENELPADTEQCPPKALALGLDHDDFIAALAPKPVILLAKEKDFFDVRGTEEAYKRLRNLYSLLDAEDHIGLFVGPTAHGYSQENREALYRWFNGVTSISDAQTEPEITIEKDETLWCTPKGQVSELNSRTVFSFTQEKAKQLAKQRKTLSGDALKDTVLSTLNIKPVTKTPYYRILRPIRSNDYPKPYASVYAVKTEQDIHAIVYRLSESRLLSRPTRGIEQAILYVSHQSSDEELREESLIRDLIKDQPSAAFYTCDVRGIGESRPDTCGIGHLHPYGSDYFYAIHSIMLDEPYAGQRTRDILSVLKWLSSQGHKHIHLVAKGWGTIPATFAALLSDGVDQVTLKNALKSYQAVAESEYYDWPLSSFIPDVLMHFDLPECYQALKDKKLNLIESVGAQY